MAEFFDNFIENVAKTTQKVSKKIDKAVNTTSLKFEVGKKKSELEALFTELGRIVSENRNELSSEEVAAKIQVLYERIDEINESINELNEKIEEEKTK